MLIAAIMMLLLYIATSTLHALLSKMAIYSAHDNRAYRIGLKETLSDRTLFWLVQFLGH